MKLDWSGLLIQGIALIYIVFGITMTALVFDDIAWAMVGEVSKRM